MRCLLPWCYCVFCCCALCGLAQCSCKGLLELLPGHLVTAKKVVHDSELLQSVVGQTVPPPRCCYPLCRVASLPLFFLIPSSSSSSSTFTALAAGTTCSRTSNCACVKGRFGSAATRPALADDGKEHWVGCRRLHSLSQLTRDTHALPVSTMFYLLPHSSRVSR